MRSCFQETTERNSDSHLKKTDLQLIRKDTIISKLKRSIPGISLLVEPIETTIETDKIVSFLNYKQDTFSGQILEIGMDTGIHAIDS